MFGSVGDAGQDNANNIARNLVRGSAVTIQLPGPILVRLRLAAELASISIESRERVEDALTKPTGNVTATPVFAQMIGLSAICVPGK